MRLIDADWVLAHIKPYELSDEDWSVTGGTAIRLIHNAIDGAPTIDAVPVVRCNDCKWFADNNGGEWYGCYMFHVVRITPEDAPKPDDFCSYGERKNGGDSDV